MNNRRLRVRLLLLTVLLATLVSGCVGQLGTGWAGLTVLDNGSQIAFAYENTLAVVDVVEGEPIPLVDDSGDVIRNSEGETALWQINGNDLDNAKFFAAPLQYGGGTLLVTTLDRRLIQFDLDTAAQTLASDSLEDTRGNAITGFVQSDGNIFLGLQEQFVALDSETLSRNWQIDTAHGVWAEPFLLEDTAYFTSLDHFMYAVDADSGDVIWALDLGGAATSVPVYDAEQDVFFVGTFESKLIKVSRDGEILDDFDTSEWVWGSPTLVDGELYVADLGGWVYKLDPQTLTAEGGWEREVAEGAIRTPPRVFEDYVVVGSRDQNVYWLDRDTGAEVFSRQLDGEILSDILYFPVEENDELEESLIVVSTLSNRESLVAFGATNGERIWTYRR